MKQKFLQAVFLLILFGWGFTAYAYTEIFPTINANGTIVLSSFPTTGCANAGVGNAHVFYGTFPDTSTGAQNDNTNTDNCQTYLANYNGGGPIDMDIAGNSGTNGDGNYFMWLGGDANPATGPTYTGSPVFNYIFSATRSGGVWATGNPIIDTTTRIISTDPFDGEIITATSSALAIAYSAYINDADLTDKTRIILDIENSAKNFEQCADIICAVNPELAPAAFSYHNEQIITEDDLVLNQFDFADTINAINPGRYFARYQIRVGGYCLLGFCLADELRYTISKDFVVASTTLADDIRENVAATLTKLTSKAATSTFAYCGITNFNFFQCGEDFLIYAFVPTPDAIQYFSDQLHENIITHFPLGYIADFVSIVSTTTIGTLPEIDATLPAALPGGGTHINLSLANKLDWALNSTSTIYHAQGAMSTSTLYEITSGYWEIIINLAALFYILRRILGSVIMGDHEDGNWPGSKNYDPTRGSGASLNQKGMRNSKGGLNLIP